MVALLAVSLMAPAGARAAIYYVDAAQPDDAGDGLSWITAKQTIQAAIGASTPGDTILVKYGAYSITAAVLIDATRLLTSDDGTHDSWSTADYDSSLCIVAPSGVSRVFTITGATVTAETRLRGFKVTGGRATSESPGALYGGGIYIAGGANLVIEHCWITSNRATTSSNGYGGGIAVRGTGTGAVIRYCRIDSNYGSTSWVGLGGGLYFEDAALSQVYGNTIVSNMASSARIGSGGGISSDNTDLLIWSNAISYNVATGPSASAGGDGGGIYIYMGVVKIWDNIITYNHACERSGYGGDGGGIYVAGGASGDSIIIFDNPAISYNTAATGGAGTGGGICAATSYTWMYGNTIEWNVATSSTNATASNRVGRGGGVCMTSSGTRMRDNMVVNNTASLNGVGYGGGVYASTAQTVERNIIAFNTASTSSEQGYGGGLWTGSASGGKIANNTVYRNANTTDPIATGAGSGLYHSTAGFPGIRNNIFAGHDVANSDSMGAVSNTVGTIWYNCFYDNPGGDYNANLTSNEEVLADPRLADPYNGDFSLLYDSPCIEEGDPAYAVPENGAWIIDIGAIEYTGTRHWRPVTGTGELLFGGRVKAKANVTTLGSLSEIDMVVHPGETHPVAPVSVARWYDIDHAGTGMEFDLTLTYLESELNGRAEDSLSMWRWTGSAWDGPKVYSARDLAANWITVSGQTDFSDWILTDDWGPTAVDDMPGRFRLCANYPNPFNPATVIAYELPGPAHIEITIYNVAGQKIRVLESGDRPAGLHRVVWDGLDGSGKQVASGVYFYRLAAGEFVRTRKMTLLR